MTDDGKEPQKQISAERLKEIAEELEQWLEKYPTMGAMIILQAGDTGEFILKLDPDDGCLINHPEKEDKVLVRLPQSQEHRKQVVSRTLSLLNALNLTCAKVALDTGKLIDNITDTLDLKIKKRPGKVRDLNGKK